MRIVGHYFYYVNQSSHHKIDGQNEWVHKIFKYMICTCVNFESTIKEDYLHTHNNVEHVSIVFNYFKLIFVFQPRAHIVFRLDKETIHNVKKSIDIVNVYWIKHVWDQYKSMQRFQPRSTTHKY